MIHFPPEIFNGFDTITALFCLCHKSLPVTWIQILIEFIIVLGATATEYGLVFGVFELTVFLVSPFLGMQINKVGAKRMFNFGILTTGWINKSQMKMLDLCFDVYPLFHIQALVQSFSDCWIGLKVEIGSSASALSSVPLRPWAIPDSCAPRSPSLPKSFPKMWPPCLHPWKPSSGWASSSDQVWEEPCMSSEATFYHLLSSDLV